MQLKVVRYKKDITYNDARELIFSDKDFLVEFGQVAEKLKLDRIKVKNECEQYLKEIAATYSNNKAFWNIMEAIVRRRIKNSFDNIFYNKEGVQAIIDLAKNNILNLVPNHRSVFDFILLPYVIIKETTYVPIILAADVFNTFPLAQIFRRFGVYFVRRKVENKFYSLIFKYYVMMISKCELLHMFFIEGGRNKTGGYSNPKKGILKYILGGAKKYSKSDVVFVPISISYDCVPEIRVVIQESKSGKRRHIFESVANYLYRSNLGNCYIKFGIPIKIPNLKINNKKMVDYIGNKLIETIKTLVVVTPTSLICYTMLNQQKMPYGIFRKKFNINYIKLRKLKSDISYIDLTKIDKYLQFAHIKNIINFNKRSKTITVKYNQIELIQYYSNNILHLFGKKSLIE